MQRHVPKGLIPQDTSDRTNCQDMWHAQTPLATVPVQGGGGEREGEGGVLLTLIIDQAY
jgi:hypothetical protein